MGQSLPIQGIRMLVLFLGLLCIIQANAVPADINTVPVHDNGLMNPGELELARDLDVHEANNAGLINPTDLIPNIYLEPTVRFVDDIEEEGDEWKEEVMDRADKTCGCGSSITNPSGRIVNGKEVNPVHSRPYQVMLQLCFTNVCSLCGGTLLNKRYVLSAMHCVYNKKRGWAKDIKAVIGEHNIQYDWETKAKEQAIRVVDIVSRRDYNTETMDNDIAILKLGEDVKFSRYVIPACLPSRMQNDYTGRSAVVSGWGAISEGGPSSKYLKETTVRIVGRNDRTCQGYRINSAQDLIKFCAYASGTDSCQGDSGGPLVLKDNGGKNTVVGVVSYGYGCARPNVAGVYAKVTGYLHWINRSIKDGWCDGSESSSSSSGGNSSNKPSSGRPCNLKCYIGSPTGNFILNGIRAKCIRGICQSTDGSDLCAALGVRGC